MADDKLRIVATVDDQFSKPLEKLRGELANTARVPGLDDLRKRFSDIEGTITRLRQTGAQLNTAGGIGGMLGLGSLTGIASVAGLAASMRDLARSQVEMRHFSRETGIAAGQLRELQELGKRFQIAPEAMTGAATSFAETMYDVRHGLGEAYGQMLQKAPGLAKELRNSKDNTEALGHALGWLSKQTDAIEQKRWADALGLGALTHLFTDGPKALQDAWKQIQASGIGKPNPELEKQSKALIDAMNRFDTSVETMKRTWGPTLLGEMATAVDKLTGSFGKFAGAYEKFRNGHPIDALNTIDGATDMGLGQRKNAPPSKPATSLDEQLDAQMRGQTAQPRAEKDRADKIAAAEARLNKAREDLGYEQRRFPVKDEGAIKTLSEQIRQLNDELRRLREDGATKQNMSFEGTTAGGLGGLIQKASLRFPGGFGSGGGGYRPGGAEFGPEGSYGGGGQAFKRLREGADDLGDGIRGRPFGKGGTARRKPGGKKGPAGIPYDATDLKGALGISDAQWSAYREGLTDIEGKRYEQVGGAGGRYSGRYQFGPREIAETARQLGEAPPSRTHFLGDKAMQERFMERYTLEHHKFLQRNSAAYRAMSPEKKLEILGYAHNQGAGRGSGRVVGALGYLESGREGRDGFGTGGTAYFRTIRRRLAEAARAGAGSEAKRQADDAADRQRAYADAQRGRPGGAPGAGRRPDILADPADERRRPDDGLLQLKPWTKAPADANMLRSARQAGVLGGAGGPGGSQSGRILGEISLKGFPAGTRADFKGEGVVQSVKLNRGSTMSAAEA